MSDVIPEINKGHGISDLERTSTITSRLIESLPV